MVTTKLWYRRVKIIKTVRGGAIEHAPFGACLYTAQKEVRGAQRRLMCIYIRLCVSTDVFLHLSVSLYVYLHLSIYVDACAYIYISSNKVYIVCANVCTQTCAHLSM